MLADIRHHLDRLLSKQKLLNSCVDHRADNQFFSFYVKAAADLTGAERGSIFISDPETRRVWVKAGLGIAEKQIDLPSQDTIVGEVIATAKPKFARDLERRGGIHKKIADDTGFVARDALCVPIFSSERQEVTGAIEVLNKKDGTFDDADRAVLEDMARHLQTSIEAVFLNQEVFGVTERLFAAARRATLVLVGVAGGAVALVFLYVAFWALSPLLVG